jgi:sugar phosphate isomerase/epimerase
MIELGMHTDNWRPLSGNFRTAVAAAVKYGLSHIEFGVIHGQYFVQGLGYDPAVSLLSNPRALRRELDRSGLKVSQIDAAFPLMGPEGSTFGVQYVQQAIRFAADLGCPYVDTTDGGSRPPGYSDDAIFRITCENYRQCLAWAEDYGVTINIETHGPYTTDGDFLERLFTHFESEFLRFNFDTGNTFIAGHDPLAYLKRFSKYLTHCHVKDVSPALAAAALGKDTGIGTSEVPLGGGVNADNIRRCVDYLKATRWAGVLSLECYGSDVNICLSVEFLRTLLGQAPQPADALRQGSLPRQSSCAPGGPPCPPSRSPH